MLTPAERRTFDQIASHLQRLYVVGVEPPTPGQLAAANKHDTLRVLIPLAAAAGWPQVVVRPAEHIGPGRESWEEYCMTARLDDLEPALQILKARLPHE